jgi:hypothetical protein
MLAATTIIAGTPGLASAQSRQNWVSVDQRQATLDQRIGVGLRNGQLSQNEAARLRAEYNTIVRLESQYRRNGLDRNERADLDRRFDQLSSNIRTERADRDGRGDRNDRGDRDGRSGRWENLNERQAQFTQRLDRAVADRRITRRQAGDLKTEFYSIAQLEQRYRRNGLDRNERAELDARFDRLQANFRASVDTRQYGYGYNQSPNLFD